MAAEHTLTRRSALAGLGAGSLGLLFGTSAAVAAPTVETGGSGSGEVVNAANHALTGRWLSRVALPSRPDVAVAVPTFFGTDGTVMMIFPGMEAEKRGIQVRGVALGCWDAVSADLGHFTAVQVLANLEGSYIGTVTIDGYAQIDEDGTGFTVRSEDNLFVVRDQADAVIEQLVASADYPMSGFRMRVGNAGFAVAAAAPAGVPEVAPVYSDDPRLHPVEQTDAPDQLAPTPRDYDPRTPY